MKYVLILLAMLLFSSFMVCDEACKQKKFRIQIREESMLWNNLYVITPDSIVIQKENRVQVTRTLAGFQLTKQQRAEIEKLLGQIPWNTLKESYVDNNAPADLYDYQFTFEWEGVTKKVRIYQYKQEEIFALVQALNRMLPAENQIGYTESYFINKR